MTGDRSQLAVFKALGDNTRYAIYLELARSPRPLATGDIAEQLDLHVNTVRPHLERMREAGLLEVHTGPHGGVGRPQHRYYLAADAPALGLEPPAIGVLARLLVRLADEAGLVADDAIEVGRDEGRSDGYRLRSQVPCLDALDAQLQSLGFDPVAVDGPAGARIAFTHCPFADLAEANPELVCGLHRGLVEGFVEAFGDHAVESFHTLVDRDPCLVDLVAVGGTDDVDDGSDR